MSKVRCPICSAGIETQDDITVCPACKEDISGKLSRDSKGITTARVDGPGLHPASDLEQDVF